MSYPVSAVGMRDFLVYLGKKGLMNTNTLQGMRVATDKVFSALDADEQSNLAGLDVDSAISRFINKNPGVLSPDSVRVYKSRVSKALELLGEYNSNPGGFKPGSSKANGTVQSKSDPRTKAAKGSKSGGRSGAGSDTHSRSIQPEDEHRQRSNAPTGAVTLTLPLRPDFVAQFIVPRDLTAKEARRLGAYFATVAIDYDPD